ncbi:unnamed protein product, partial [marine sediment metagenome]
LVEARKNIDWCGYHLEQVISIYRADHPEVSNPLETYQKMLVEVDKGIDRVRGSF